LASSERGNMSEGFEADRRGGERKSNHGKR